MDTFKLKDGGLLLYDEAFLPSDFADRYFVELRDNCQWEQKPGIFGFMQPRLIASYGDAGITYKYSGVENVALPWTPILLEIKNKIESVQGAYNYCLLNRYRSGSDSMGWHADDEPEMGNVMMAMLEHLVIVAAIILSVGCVNAVEEPKFNITTKRDNDAVEIKVEIRRQNLSEHCRSNDAHRLIVRGSQGE